MEQLKSGGPVDRRTVIGALELAIGGMAGAIDHAKSSLDQSESILAEKKELIGSVDGLVGEALRLRDQNAIIAHMVYECWQRFPLKGSV